MIYAGSTLPNVKNFLDVLRHEVGLAPRLGTSGASATTFAIGGDFECLLEPNSESELRLLAAFLSKSGVVPRIIGAGSNTLLPSAGICGVAIRLGRGLRSYTRLSETEFRVGGAYALMALSRELSEDGLSGLEFAGGIPGSIGGAIRMNAGAHGSEMSSVLEEVSIVCASGEVRRIAARELQFEYRTCGLPEGSIVSSAVMRLCASDREATRKLRAEHLEERKRRQPLQLPSAGSIFRNPLPQAAGALIERAGLKGQTRGGAEISSMHANWIVNPRRTATDLDVKALIELCQLTVKARFQIELKPELVIWA